MNQNNQNNQNNQENMEEKMRDATIKLIKTASVILGIAIITFCYGYTKTEGAAQAVTYILGAILCFIATTLITVTLSARRAFKNKRNFFLYDKKKKADIAPAELTFDVVRSKICEFMSIFKHRGKLYIGDLFSNDDSVPEHFKPLFCYELLYELAIDDGLEAGVFLSFGSECAEVFAKYLRENEDYDLANKIYAFIVDFEAGNRRTAEFKQYMNTQAEHIKSKMLGYTISNIEKVS